MAGELPSFKKDEGSGLSRLLPFDGYNAFTTFWRLGVGIRTVCQHDYEINPTLNYLYT